MNPVLEVLATISAIFAVVVLLCMGIVLFIAWSDTKGTIGYRVMYYPYKAAKHYYRWVDRKYPPG